MVFQRNCCMIPTVTVNILGYKSREKLSGSIPAVLAQDYPNFEVVFIDNNSGDGSEEYVKENFPQVKVIQTDANLGYAGGHNRGIKESDADFVCFLNPDIILPPNYLS